MTGSSLFRVDPPLELELPVPNFHPPLNFLPCFLDKEPSRLRVDEVEDANPLVGGSLTGRLEIEGKGAMVLNEGGCDLVVSVAALLIVGRSPPRADHSSRCGFNRCGI